MPPPRSSLPRHPANAIKAEPLTALAYARYGHALSLENSEGRSANQGSARRIDFATQVENRREAAKLNVSLFRCEPRANPFEVTLLERHAHSSQLFVPMNASRYLVVVAEGGDKPDLSTLKVFVAQGAQAICYAPGIWHHPMIALNHAIDFTCLVYEDGSAADCQEFPLEAPFLVTA